MGGRRRVASLDWPPIALVGCNGWLSFLGTVLAERPIRTCERVELPLAAVDVDVIIVRLLVSPPLFTLGRMIIWPWLCVDIFGIRDLVHIPVGLAFLLGLLV